MVGKGVRAISLVKGVEVTREGEMKLYSDVIREKLGGVECNVMMGANIAEEVAKGMLSESTIGKC